MANRDICDDEDDENLLGLARSQGPETPKVRVSMHWLKSIFFSPKKDIV